MYITTTQLSKKSNTDKLAIKQLQAMLNFLGEKLIIDGDYGTKSIIAVKVFQKAQNIGADGIAGDGCWAKLYEENLALSETLIAEQNEYEELSIGATSSDHILWLQSMFYLIDNSTKTTAKFDKRLEETILAFQSSSECTENGCVDFDTWQKLFEKVKEEIARVKGCLLTDEYISKRAEENDLSPAAVKAVVKVESNGRGFRRDGSLKILFEGHIFWKELEKVGLNPHNHIEGNEDIVYKKSTYAFYASSLQNGRLKKARDIHDEAGLRSASYGMFQIMGFNHVTAGFDSVEVFIASLKVSEANQLEAFLTFVKNTNGCFEALQNKDWSEFARIYNGKSYKKNKYDEKMEKHYNSSPLAKGIGNNVMDEEAYTSMYALELEKAFSEFEG